MTVPTVNKIEGLCICPLVKNGILWYQIDKSKALEVLNLKGFLVVTVGLEPTLLTALCLFGQVRYSREPTLERRSHSLAHHASASLHPPLAALRLRAP